MARLARQAAASRGRSTGSRWGWASRGLPVLGHGSGRGGRDVDLAARVRGVDFAESQTLNVSDQLIVSIGDSVASGEGNPDTGGLFSAAEWIGRRCHRSMLSDTQAALAAERADAGSSISFVPLGCSGATVPTGCSASTESSPTAWRSAPAGSRQSDPGGAGNRRPDSQRRERRRLLGHRHLLREGRRLSRPPLRSRQALEG